MATNHSIRRCRECGIVKCLADFSAKGTSRLCKACLSEYGRRRHLRKLSAIKKKCVKCEKTLPLPSFRNKQRFGRSDMCLDCEKAYIRCSKCGQIKRPVEFAPDKVLATGRASWCRECTNDHSASVRRTPEGKAKRQSYRRRPEVRQKHLDYLKRYFMTEAGQEAIKRFKESDKGQINSARRRGISETVKCTLTLEEWKQIVKGQKNRCYYCQRRFHELSLPPTKDHVKPVLKGGDHTKENIVASCLHCNVSKGKHDWPITKPDGSIIEEELLRRVANGHHLSGVGPSSKKTREIVDKLLSSSGNVPGSQKSLFD